MKINRGKLENAVDAYNSAFCSEASETLMVLVDIARSEYLTPELQEAQFQILHEIFHSYILFDLEQNYYEIPNECLKYFGFENNGKSPVDYL